MSDPSSDLPDGAERKQRSLLAGIGCFSVFVLSCGLLAWWGQAYFTQWVMEGDSPLRETMSRQLTTQLVRVSVQNCEGGQVRGDALQWFHQSASDETRSLVCRIDVSELPQPDAETESAIPGELLSETEQAGIATKVGLDPANCYRYRSSSWAIVGCYDPEAGGAVPYVILDIHSSDP